MTAVLPQADWSLAKKTGAAAFLAAVGVTLACAASIGSAAVYLALHKVDPRLARLHSMRLYWSTYGNDPVERRRLLFSIATVSVGLFVILPGVAIASMRRRRPLHGDARFATLAEIRRAGLLLDDGLHAPPCIVVGRHRGRYLGQPGQLSVMLSAPTRSGKGVGVVIPNLLTWPDSVVVLDIKGENHAVTAGYRAACGQAVFAFSPFDEAGRSHRWNPLTALRADPMHRIGDLLTIGQVFFPNDVGGTSAEAFFNDQARNLFLAIGLFLLETPELPRTLGEMLRQSSGKGRAIQHHFAAEIERRQASRAPLSPECTHALQRLLANSENTLTSIVATFNAPLLMFADAIVDCSTSGDDFNLAHVRRLRMSVYVRIPPHRLASARPLLSLFFSQLINLNTNELPEQDPSLKFQCLLVQDEFTSMGRVGAVSSAAAFLAGYNLRLLTVVQAMSQLDAVYGEKEARTFATNHGLQILFAPREQRDADEYSAMLGTFTERVTSKGRSRSFGPHGHNSVSYSETDQRRALLLPQEFKEIGADRLVVVAENCKPILATKIRYHRDPDFKCRLLRPPVVPLMRIDLHLAKIQHCIRVLPDELDEIHRIDVSELAIETGLLPELPIETGPADVQRFVDAFLDALQEGSVGGLVDAAEDDEAPGEHTAPTSAGSPTLDLATLEKHA